MAAASIRAGYDWDPVIRDSPELAGHVPVRLVGGGLQSGTQWSVHCAMFSVQAQSRHLHPPLLRDPGYTYFHVVEYTEDLATLFREGEEVDSSERQGK